ncbi:MAG: pitrilysin family protein [Acidobacteriota bacterium]|nr:pitrilysin family protein [Acidobacteriota bacterium]
MVLGWARVLLLTWFVALVGVAGLRADAPVDLQDRLVTRTLANGMHVTVLPDPALRTVATELWVHVGSANEEQETRGFAHLFEHLMFGGTVEHSKEDYALLHESHGGYENAFTSFDETVYISEIPPAGHDEVLALEADRLVNLALSEENLANEKKIVTEELRLRTENDPMVRVMLTALEAILGEHPYAVTPAGTKEDIARADLEQARGFYRRYYRPSNVHLVVVGPVDPRRVLARVEEVFGSLEPGAGPPEDVPEVMGWPMPGLVRLEEDLPPVETVIAGFPLPSPDSADHAALEVMRELLGGGRIDPFVEELVRRRKKAIYAQTEHLEFRKGGAVIFAAAFLPYHRERTERRLVRETLQVLARMEWLDEAGFEGARRRLLQRVYRGAYSPVALADSLGRARWWRGDEKLALRHASELEAVRLEDVRRVYRTYLAEAEPVMLIIRPEHVPLYVQLFGWLYPLLQR